VIEFTYTVIVVAADDNAIAVDRRADKTRAGSSINVAWRAAVRVGITTAGNLNPELELPRKIRTTIKIYLLNGTWGGGDGTDNSNSKEGNDLSDLHLDRRE